MKINIEITLNVTKKEIKISLYNFMYQSNIKIKIIMNDNFENSKSINR